MSDVVNTKESIIADVWYEWERAVAIYEQLEKKPVIALKKALVTKQESTMGLANSSTGEIKINDSFIGIKAHKDLIDVIRHEICHFLVGLEEGHNKVWKNACKIIGCKTSSIGVVNDINFLEKTYKYKLLATTEDFNTYLVGFHNQKLERFLNYTPLTETLNNKGRIIQYHYIDLSTGEVIESNPTLLLNDNPAGATKNTHKEQCIGRYAQKSSKLLNATLNSFVVNGKQVKVFYYKQVA